MKKIILLLLILSSGCFYDPPMPANKQFTVSNNSREAIICFASVDTTFNDLAAIINKQTKPFFPLIDLDTGETDYLPHVIDWNLFIQTNGLDSTITIYTISKDVVNQFGWDSIVKNRKYIEKKTLTIHELDSLKWNVKFNQSI